jgi:hypothetical protein
LEPAGLPPAEAAAEAVPPGGASISPDFPGQWKAPEPPPEAVVESPPQGGLKKGAPLEATSEAGSEGGARVRNADMKLGEPSPANLPEHGDTCGACEGESVPTASKVLEEPEGGFTESVGAKPEEQQGVAAVRPPPTRTPEQLARAAELKKRIEAYPFGGRFKNVPFRELTYYRQEEIPPDYLKGYQGMADFIWDVDRPIERIQELESRVVERVAQTGVTKDVALEQELTESEARHGFKPAIDLEPRSYTDDEFAAMLRDGALFRDQNFTDSNLHGVQTHRMQMWAVSREMELNPEAFGPRSASELYAGMGRYAPQSNALWGDMFDSAAQHTSFGGVYSSNADLFPGLPSGM